MIDVTLFTYYKQELFICTLHEHLDSPQVFLIIFIFSVVLLFCFCSVSGAQCSLCL